MSTHYPTPSASGLPYREDAHPPSTFGPRPLPSYPRHERSATEGLSLVDRPSQLQRPQRTPPRSPVSQKTPPLDSRGTQPPPGAAPFKRTLSSLPVQEDEPSSAENTVRHDEAIRYLGMLEGRLGTGSETVMPLKSQSRTLPPRAPSPPAGPPDLISFHDSDDGTNITVRTNRSDDSDKDGDTYWAVRPQNRPTLPPINTENNNRPSGSGSGSGSSSGPTSQSHTASRMPPVPNYIPEPLPARPLGRTPGTGRKAQDQRTSKFDNNFDYTWAPRPPPEEVFESLQDYFPEHDVDEPVIESGSGGTSPTSAEPDPLPQNERRFKHKKSIRVVAAEHKKRVDRTTRAEASAAAVNTTLRKRNTKLWGSRLEEVTMDRAQGQQLYDAFPSATDASPGQAKRKWLSCLMIRLVLELICDPVRGFCSDFPLGSGRAYWEGDVREGVPGAQRYHWRDDCCQAGRDASHCE